ncbi:uncharacterized protein DS421_3g73030 [Arachis hypogaea]|nr:uncharacterized protein DS421_3g73030 [Arachis hypogaea]
MGVMPRIGGCPIHLTKKKKEKEGTSKMLVHRLFALRTFHSFNYCRCCIYFC